jgi:hypothetical protein
VSRYCLSHLPDPDLLRALRSLVAQDRATTASLLAHLTEVDARKLYLPAAYPSMFDYCVGELGLSEQSAFKRIRAARVARQFPALFTMIAEGRLHLSAVIVLSSYLTPANADELLAAAAGKSKAKVEQLLAERFPRSETLALVTGVSPRGDEPLSPGRVDGAGSVTAGRKEPPPPRSKEAPIVAERYALQLTIGRATHDKLRYAQALLGHQLPAGELAQVLDRALDALIRQLEHRKFAATDRPRPRRRPSAHPRHVPAEVRRAVWERDGGRCTFVSEAGRRCPARERLEFDHVEPVARGGRATVQGIRLRCRAHNQFAAEIAFGSGFMARKREEAAAERARRGAAGARAADARAREAAERAQASAEVIPWLRQLGFRADEARRAAAACDHPAQATLEERVRFALCWLARGRVRGGPPGQAPCLPAAAVHIADGP